MQKPKISQKSQKWPLVWPTIIAQKHRKVGRFVAISPKSQTLAKKANISKDLWRSDFSKKNFYIGFLAFIYI